MKHLCRDFLTLNSASCPGTNMYAISAFLLHCGGYTLVGQTNFNLLSSSVSLANGTSASINYVNGPYDVFLPTASYTVSAHDINRILALKSAENPLANSGLFRITNYDLPTNTVTIDYRSSQYPQSERVLEWRVLENELSFSAAWRTGSNLGFSTLSIKL